MSDHEVVKVIEPPAEPQREREKPDENRPGARFDDDYWDEAFDTLYDPSMRVCSAFGCC